MTYFLYSDNAKDGTVAFPDTQRDLAVKGFTDAVSGGQEGYVVLEWLQDGDLAPAPAVAEVAVPR